jgi:hypothetical protein
MEALGWWLAAQLVERQQERCPMVKKGQLEVSKMDSPRQGEHRDPHAPKIKRKGGSQNQTLAHPQSEGSRSKG